MKTSTVVVAACLASLSYSGVLAKESSWDQTFGWPLETMEDVQRVRDAEAEARTKARAARARGERYVPPAFPTPNRIAHAIRCIKGKKMIAAVEEKAREKEEERATKAAEAENEKTRNQDKEKGGHKAEGEGAEGTQGDSQPDAAPEQPDEKKSEGKPIMFRLFEYIKGKIDKKDAENKEGQGAGE
jgi:type IV secretory pathway VirB10-like protein